MSTTLQSVWAIFSYCSKMDCRDYPCLITPKTLCPTNHLRIRSRDSGGGRTSLGTLSGEVEKILLFVSLEKVSTFPYFCFPWEDVLVADRCTCHSNFLLETWTAVLDCQILQGAKKIIFTACHSGKLKLAFTSPDDILTPDAFWQAELIS